MTVSGTRPAGRRGLPTQRPTFLMKPWRQTSDISRLPPRTSVPIPTGCKRCRCRYRSLLRSWKPVSHTSLSRLRVEVRTPSSLNLMVTPPRRGFPLNCRRNSSKSPIGSLTRISSQKGQEFGFLPFSSSLY